MFNYKVIRLKIKNYIAMFSFLSYMPNIMNVNSMFNLNIEIKYLTFANKKIIWY